jgi:hypothetical protein
MSVGVVRVDPTSRTVTFTAQNTGAKIISAWKVDIVAGTEPEVGSGGYAVDGFRSLEGLVAGSSYIRPNETITVTAPLPRGTSSLTPVAVTASAAVFADNSFAGDTQYAQGVFEERRRQLEAWQDIAGQLDEVRRGGTVNAARLRQLLAGIDTSIALNGGDIVRRTFRTNLALRLADVEAGRAQALATLTGFAQDASRNIAAATAHSAR